MLLVPYPEKQFSYALTPPQSHLVCMVLNSEQPNRMFQAPIGDSPKVSEHLLRLNNG